MNLYILNPNLQLTKTQSKYLLDHLYQYNNENCNIVEVNNLQDINRIHYG